MKIFDCITYYDEELLFDLRCHQLNNYVDYFVVVEAKFTHSGKKKKLNFNINNFSKFKDKIIYHVIENEPEDIVEIVQGTEIANKLPLIRINGLKRIEQSYECCLEAVDGMYSDNDYFMLSDSDEIPNIKNETFSSNKSKVILFEQDFFYYKFNLFYDLLPWYGTRACKFKNLISASWLRNTKHKPYPLWRLDTLFNRYKLMSLNIIKNGGWHFSNLKLLDDIISKLDDSGHQDEYLKNSNYYSEIKKMIENKQVYYDHFVDKKTENKIRSRGYDLKKIKLDLLPDYIRINKDKVTNFLE